jgi:hypothetical protein
MGWPPKHSDKGSDETRRMQNTKGYNVTESSADSRRFASAAVGRRSGGSLALANPFITKENPEALRLTAAEPLITVPAGPKLLGRHDWGTSPAHMPVFVSAAKHPRADETRFPRDRPGTCRRRAMTRAG